ncbi:MAG TPA: hypothetical protein VE861_03000, partial [Gemmatimonadaceae bacterium]|nr:hypothetical protein [Gemmatimonadaceae bacterium]
MMFSRLVLLAAQTACVALAAPVPVAAQAAASPLALSMADAAKRARESGLSVLASAVRASQVEARVNQRRADLLPQLGGIAEANSRTFNTATLGIRFPAAPGQQPFFDPRGEVLGPVPISDVRARVQQTVLDVAALQRVRAARQQGTAARSETEQVGAAAATQAAIAYVRTPPRRAAH